MERRLPEPTMKKPDPAESRGLSPSLEQGLAAAFGPDPAKRSAAVSVMGTLERTRGIRPTISLREPSSGVAEKLLRPRGTQPSEFPSIAGKYQLQGEIARGGMGIVLRGHDVDLGRDVAMKVLHGKYRDHPELLQRFVEEAQIGGQLQHPGIVPVYDLGLEEGHPYFTMKLIKGETLAARLAEGSPGGKDLHRTLAAFVQVCQTLAYAHARGVIHRDLKPANIMMGSFGEVQVVDWGMGKVLTSGGSADELRSKRSGGPPKSVIETLRSSGASSTEGSVAGSVMGTPAYMPPEQARGEVDFMDERSDVFSLGAILCEILTGAPPYLGSSAEAIQQASEARLEDCLGRLEDCDADEELKGIAIEALAPMRSARPRNAGALADQLSRYLHSVEDRLRESQIEAAQQRTRVIAAQRARRLTVGLAISIGALVVLTLSAWWGFESLANSRELAATQRLAASSGTLRSLWGEARGTQVGDLSPWMRADTAASALDTALRSPHVGEQQRQELQSLLTSFESEKASAEAESAAFHRDEALRERLLRIRVPSQRVWMNKQWLVDDALRQDEAFAGALGEFLGVAELEELEVSEAAERFQGSELRFECAVILEHWALLRDIAGADAKDSTDPRTPWLRSLARALAPEDPWMVEIRPYLLDLETHRPHLETLAVEFDPSKRTPAQVALLAEALWNSESSPQALELLRRGCLHDPQDFVLSLQYALRLGLNWPPPWDEVCARLRLAHALQPDVDGVLGCLSVALANNNRLEESLEIDELLVARNPEDAQLRYGLAMAYRAMGFHEKALDTSLEVTELESAPAAKSAAQSLISLDRPEEATAYLRLYIEPERYGASLGFLANHLKELAQFDEARTLLVEARDDILEHKFDPPIRERLLSQTQTQLDEIDAIPRSEEILSGTAEPDSELSWLHAGRLAYRTGDFAASARVYRDGFRAYPPGAGPDADRLRAARAASLAGTDSDALEGGQRAEQGVAHRRFALDLLRAELDAQAERAAQFRALPLSDVATWNHLRAFEGVRDRIETLPASEQDAWREFWKEVGIFLDTYRSDPPIH